MGKLDIDADITRAATLPSETYGDPATYRAQLDGIFARSWHVVAARADVEARGHATPFTLLEGSLDEPLVLVRDAAGTLRCLSNVCTHRGNILVSEACPTTSLRCRYHGRRFSLDGRFAFMPELEGAVGFPSPADDLPRVPHALWGPLVLAGLDPVCPLDEMLAPVARRLGPLGLEAMTLDRATSRDYEVRAHWALYCDNYLEGFHVPFVHASLAETLDYAAYETETFAWGSMQIGIAKEGEPTLELPAGHPDHGRRVAAYYVFLFPGTMLNVYPWGLSVNAIRPLGPDRTRVSFLSFVSDASKRDSGAGADLHRVELEDEAVVEAVQRGVRSRLYKRGRYSPTREIAVHHFHRLIAASCG